MNAQSPLFQIEAKRLALGVSREQLASAAGVSWRHYQRLFVDGRTPRPTTLGKLRAALSRLGRVAGAQDDMTRLVSALYHAALALLCHGEAIGPADVLRHAPARRATADKEWLAASRIRQRAIALVNQGLDLPQSELARALNMTPAAVSLAMGAVEDARQDDPVLDARLDALERLLRGEE